LAENIVFGFLVLGFLAYIAYHIAKAFFPGARGSGEKKFSAIQVIAFDANNRAFKLPPGNWKVRLNEQATTLELSAVGKRISYALSSDVLCIEIQDQKQEKAIGKTMRRMALTGLASELLSEGAGLGGAVMDFAIRGSHERTIVSAVMMMSDYTMVSVETTDEEFRRLLRSLPPGTNSDAMSAEAARRLEAADRMVADGPRVLNEFDANIESLSQRQSSLLATATHANSFNERDTARQQAKEIAEAIRAAANLKKYVLWRMGAIAPPEGVPEAVNSSPTSDSRRFAEVMKDGGDGAKGYTNALTIAAKVEKATRGFGGWPEWVMLAGAASLILLVLYGAIVLSRSHDVPQVSKQTPTTPTPSLTVGAKPQEVTPTVSESLSTQPSTVAEILSTQRSLTIPPPIGLVNDFANIIPAEQAARIERLGRLVREKSKGEITVVTLIDIGGRDVGEIALRIGREWNVGTDSRIGDPARNAGTVILFVVNDTSSNGNDHIAITSGKDNEGFITDGIAGSIRLEAMPLLTQHLYGDGLEIITKRVAQRYATRFSFSLDSAVTAVGPSDANKATERQDSATNSRKTKETQIPTPDAKKVDGTALVAQAVRDIQRMEAGERSVNRVITALYQATEFRVTKIEPSQDRANFAIHLSYGLPRRAIDAAMGALRTLASREVRSCRPWYFNQGWKGACLGGNAKYPVLDTFLVAAAKSWLYLVNVGRTNTIYFSFRSDETMAMYGGSDDVLPGGDDRTFVFDHPMMIEPATPGMLSIKLEGSSATVMEIPLLWGGCKKYAAGRSYRECQPASMFPPVSLNSRQGQLMIATQQLEHVVRVPRDALNGATNVVAVARW
jgi:hypothetical protein